MDPSMYGDPYGGGNSDPYSNPYGSGIDPSMYEDPSNFLGGGNPDGH